MWWNNCFGKFMRVFAMRNVSTLKKKIRSKVSPKETEHVPPKETDYRGVVLGSALGFMGTVVGSCIHMHLQEKTRGN